MAFPDIKVELGLSDPSVPIASTTWADITRWVKKKDRLVIDRGRSLELDDFQAGSFSLTLRNDDRRFDPTYIDESDGYLLLDGSSGCNASTPDSGSLDLPGDIDVRIAVAADDWTPSTADGLVSKFGGVGNRSWRSHVNPANIAVGYTDAGGSEAVHATTQAQVGGLVDGGIAYLRFTIDLDDGAGNHVYTMWKSTDQGQSWTSVEVETTAGVLAPFNSTAAIEIGTQQGGTTLQLEGKVYWAEIRNGIGGTVVASPDFRNLPQGTTSFLDAQGNVWTLNGTAQVIGRQQSPYAPNLLPMRRIRITATINGQTFPLFSGFVRGWPQEYEPPFSSEVQITCVDGFEALTRAGLNTSVYALEIADDTPIVWWRLGEQAGKVLADSSGNAAHGRYTFDAASSTRQGLNAFDPDRGLECDGAYAMAIVTDTRGRVPTGAHTFECILSVPAGLDFPTQYEFFEQGLIGGVGGFRFRVRQSQTNTERVVLLASADGQVTDFGTPALEVDRGAPIHFVWVYDGTGTDGKIYANGVLVDTAESGSPGFPSVPRVSIGGSIFVGSDEAHYEGGLDEIAIYDDDLSEARIAAHYAALTEPWEGDASGARIGRILDLIDWPAADRDIDTGLSTLGPARLVGSALALMKAIERAEQGRLYMGADGKVIFKSRHAPLLDNRSVTSQAAFGDNVGEIPYAKRGLRIGYDVDLIYNNVTVSRDGGPEITAEDATSRGQFFSRDDPSLLTNLDLRNDDEVANLANWRLIHYKDPHLRIPQIEIKAHAKPGTAMGDQLWAKALGLEILDRVTVKRRPQRIGAPIADDFYIEGIRHECDNHEWTTTFFLSPAESLQYWVLGTSQLGVDTRLAY